MLSSNSDLHDLDLRHAVGEIFQRYLFLSAGLPVCFSVVSCFLSLYGLLITFFCTSFTLAVLLACNILYLMPGTGVCASLRFFSSALHLLVKYEQIDRSLT